MNGEHRVAGKIANLANITCPVLTITASRDHICPPPAATALDDLVSSDDSEVFEVPGGHVGAVVGSKAPRMLHPKIVEWIEAHGSKKETKDAA